MKKILLLGLLLLSGCKSTTSVYQKLKDGEELQIHFAQPINNVSYLEITHDEINWYQVNDDWFILDYKADPGTYYIDMDNILSWGIER